MPLTISLAPGDKWELGFPNGTSVTIPNDYRGLAIIERMLIAQEVEAATVGALACPTQTTINKALARRKVQELGGEWERRGGTIHKRPTPAERAKAKAAAQAKALEDFLEELGL